LGGLLIGRPHTVAEPVWGVVHHANPLFDVVKTDDRNGWAELFLGDHSTLWVRVNDQRRSHKVTAGPRPGWYLTEFVDLGTGVLGLLDEFVDVFQLASLMQRSHGGFGIAGGAKFYLLESRGQFIDELLLLAGVYVDPLGVPTDLSGGSIDSPEEGVHIFCRKLCVLQYKHGDISTQFSQNIGQRFCRHGHNAFAAVDLTGETYLGDVGIRHQCAANLGVFASHYVEYSCR